MFSNRPRRNRAAIQVEALEGRQLLSTKVVLNLFAAADAGRPTAQQTWEIARGSSLALAPILSQEFRDSTSAHHPGSLPRATYYAENYDHAVLKVIENGVTVIKYHLQAVMELYPMPDAPGPGRHTDGPVKIVFASANVEYPQHHHRAPIDGSPIG